jgi:hypothetical protein
MSTFTIEKAIGSYAKSPNIFEGNKQWELVTELSENYEVLSNAL